MSKQKLEQHFYVGEIIQDTNEDCWEVLSVRFKRGRSIGGHRWIYELKYSKSLFTKEEDMFVKYTSYKLIQPSEERLWK